ncbi:DUF3847 domain-containing protein [Neobacillus mesonae]|uniref:DUF3847 domain-containing protein n=1 Tax=Neobacillus mesonae TaxID=1193713 RepID=UPI00203DD6E4|nr:DUF3847 domain-containing protein [Neobacillus mesonae]MCM3571267.1 DUF3847 domain-containing protein [Neobacillus mesonae]
MENDEIRKINNKIKVLEQKKKILEHKISSEDRKARTRRLIQKGALLEKYLEAENESIKDIEILLKVLADFRNRNLEYVNRQIQILKDDQ